VGAICDLKKQWDDGVGGRKEEGDMLEKESRRRREKSQVCESDR
jgi:hypothetical protein